MVTQIRMDSARKKWLRGKASKVNIVVLKKNTCHILTSSTDETATN